MKILLYHPTGNSFVRAATSGLFDAHLLSEFHTGIASFPGELIDRLGTIRFLAEIHRRRLDPKLKAVTRLWPWLELGRLIASRVGVHKLIQHEKGPFCIDAVYHQLDRRVAAGLKDAINGGTNAVYAYEDGALASFREAKQLGMSCFYDLPIGYWRTARRLLEKERVQWPAWASTIKGFTDSEEKLKRKDEELRLADRIFVASRFTANTLKDFPGPLAPIEVIPYGFPPVAKLRHYDSAKARPLRLLFVGGLSQRKGIANLFAAVDALLPHVSLTVIGYKASNECAVLDNNLKKHRWIPSLPHAGILKQMAEHDVLVFPSLFEGFGLVITEAMSQGTPVITTERTAGPDLIAHGHNGWLIEAGSTQALQEMLENLLLHPHQIANAGKAARDTARSRPWEVYGKELAEAVRRK